MNRLRILPFDTPPSQVFSKKGGECISSITELFAALRKSKGDADKPVRILVNDSTKKALIAKFGFSEDTLRQPCIADELLNHKGLLASNLVSPHLALMVWGGTTVEPGRTSPSTVVCTEYIFPVRGNHTLRQLAAAGHDIEWRQALFQTLFTLLNMQTKFAWFRHNDLKADNVLVTSPPVPSCSYSVDSSNDLSLSPPQRLRRVWKFVPEVWIKIIDFELSFSQLCSPLCSKAILNGEGGNLEQDYGLSSRRCDSFDIHLLFFDVMQVMNAKTSSAFLSFVHEFFAPELFQPQNLTRQCRLKVEQQDYLQLHSKHILLRMISHPYFFCLRDDSNSPASYELSTTGS